MRRRSTAKPAWQLIAANCRTANGTATQNAMNHSAMSGSATHCQRAATTVCHVPTIYVGSGGSNRTIAPRSLHLEVGTTASASVATAKRARLQIEFLRGCA